MSGSSPVAGLVLASGLSARFGRENKLLALYRGEPVVRRTVTAYVGAELDPVLVVVGHDAPAVRTALAGLPVHFIDNPDFRQGQSRALVRGIRVLSPSTEAAVIGVADQPELRAEVITGLVAAYLDSGAPVVAPQYGNARGNPVLFSRPLFAELLEVKGDVGGRPVLERHRSEIFWMHVKDTRLGADVDTPDELRRLLNL